MLGELLQLGNQLIMKTKNLVIIINIIKIIDRKQCRIIKSGC